MIKFCQVYIQYVNEFYSLYDFSCVIKNHTLFVGDFFDGTKAIMRILSGIDKNYKGEIFIDDINLKNIKDKDFLVAYLPENPVLFENKNIFKNLYYPLKIRKINKNIAKNLIYSEFLELKKKNLNFLDKYLNNEIKDILNIKTKKLNLSEQKIIALLRAQIREPKYILLENFFEDLDERYFNLAFKILNKIKNKSIVIACEKDETKLELFKDFNIIKLSHSD